MITQETKLNLIPGGAPPIVHVSQYDVGRTLTFGLVAGSETFNIPTGTAAQIVGTKPDKYGFAYDCTVDIANSSVSVMVEEQMTAVAGNTICEIRLTRSGANIGTANFVLRVEQAALGDDTVVSDSDIALAQQILDELGDYDVYGAALDQAVAASEANTNELAVLSARMDTFASLDEGSTTGDAELQDIRVSYEGVTYPTAGDAVRAEVAGLDAEIADLPHYRYAGNIDEVGNGFVKVDGTIASNVNYKYVKYIPKAGAEKIKVETITVYGTSSNYAAFAFFTSAGTLIKVIRNQEINQTATAAVYENVEEVIPANTAYVLITFGGMNGKTLFPNITESGLYQPEKRLRVLNQSVLQNGLQQIYFHLPTADISPYGGLSANIKLHTEQPITGYDVYFVGYDEDYSNRLIGTFRDNVTDGIDGNDVTITMNFQDTTKSLASKYWNGCLINLRYQISTEESGVWRRIMNFFAVTAEYALINGMPVTLGQYPSTGAVLRNVPYHAPYNPLYGGYFCAVGDSLTGTYYKAEEETWVHLIALWNNMRYENHGISSNPLAKPEGYSGKCMAERVDELPNNEYTHIMVMGGANDFNNSVPIGENSDTEITTFKGAVNHIITSLTAKFPTAHILFATTYRRNANYNDKPYADAMLEVCRLRSIPCLNNYENSGVQFFDANWIAKFGATNAPGNNHLNAAGDLFVAPRFEQALKYGVF